MQGFAGIVGRPNDGQRCLCEEGSGPKRHGLRSPLAERRWLRGRKSGVVGESRATLKAAFPIASGVVPWKAQNRMVGHPLIRLDH